MGLQVNGDGDVIADFDSGTQGGRVVAKFDINRGGGLVVATPDPNVFIEFAASIEEVRHVTSAVIAFSVASHARVKE